MQVAVIVPFRGSCPYRERAWDWVQTRYAERHPEWELIEAPAPEGPWCKGAALAPAMEECSAEIVIQADADCWTDGLERAVYAVICGHVEWAVPHRQVRRLSERSTEAVFGGADPATQGDLAQRPYIGILGGGFVVATREVLRAAPVDPRFQSWGQEDESHAIALNALFGTPWRGAADLYHLWHPPQERMTRRRGSQESWELRRRYARAKDDPAAIAALIEESRVDREADEAGNDPSPCGVR